MIKKVQTYANTARYFLHSRYQQSGLDIPFVCSNDVGTVDDERFDDILSQYDDDVVFVHAGLSDVKNAFGTNPYRFLLNKLDEHFKSILAPGFTPSFRSTGLYHKQFSKPEVGAFSRLFLDDANYRTDDAIHSILVRGDYRFNDCNHQNSFSDNSCWEQLDKDNILYMNIGTPWLISTQHHYLEHRFDVPYISRNIYRGIIYHDCYTYSKVSQTNYNYKMPVKRSSKKIEVYLKNSHGISKFNLEGLEILLFRAQDMRKALSQKIKQDPYYLVT